MLQLKPIPSKSINPLVLMNDDEIETQGVSYIKRKKKKINKALK